MQLQEKIKWIYAIGKRFDVKSALVLYIQAVEKYGIKKRILFRNRKLVMVNTKEGVYIVHRPYIDWDPIVEVLGRMVYIPSPIFKIGSEDVVVDIGAHIGTFSIYAGKKAYNGLVVAYEPIPQNFELLKKNILINNLDRIVTPRRKAIYGNSGELTLVLPEGSYDMAHPLFSKKKSGCSLNKKRLIKVEAITLSQIFSEEGLDRIDFLKMDCEGSEYEILLKSDINTLKKIRKISAEIHINNDLDWRLVRELQQKLEKCGFSVKISNFRKGSPPFRFVCYLYGYQPIHFNVKPSNLLEGSKNKVKKIIKIKKMKKTMEKKLIKGKPPEDLNTCSKSSFIKGAVLWDLI